MLKWVINWSEAQTYKDTVREVNGVVWAIKMPKDYPECRVTRRGIANIAITDEEIVANELREDGGDVRIMP